MPALCIICFFYSCQSTLVVPIKNIKVQLVFLGDSFTDGIGTTGTNSSTSVPRVHGNMSFPLQTVRDLNDTAIFKPVIRGYPGQTAIGYINQQLQADLALFYPKDYDEIICVIEFGANDLTSYVNTSVTDFAKNIVTLHGLVKAISPKIKTIVMPVAPRLDMAFNNDFNTKRNEYNNWISNNYKTFANAYGDYTNYQQVYADHADNCSYFFNYLDVDHLTGVHPTDRGAAVIAEMAVQSIVATAGINLPEQPAITVPADNQQRLLFKGLLTENPPGTYTG
jgi:lysophospholipase L1-like esterase